MNEVHFRAYLQEQKRLNFMEESCNKVVDRFNFNHSLWYVEASFHSYILSIPVGCIMFTFFFGSDVHVWPIMDVL